MNKTLARALISVAVAFVVGFFGIIMCEMNENLVYIAAIIAGGAYWIGSKE